MIPMTLIVIPAVILQLAPLVRFKNYSDIHFRLTFLSLMLLSFIQHFYGSIDHIIGAAGVGIWWLYKKINPLRMPYCGLCFCMILGIDANDGFDARLY